MPKVREIRPRTSLVAVPKNRLLATIWLMRPWNAIVLDFSFVLAAAIVVLHELPSLPLLPSLLLLMLACATGHGAGTVLNDISDVEVDKELRQYSRKKGIREHARPLVVGHATLRDAWIFYFFLCLLSLVAGWLLSPSVFFLMVLGVLAGIVYSLKPFRIKDVPILNESFVVVTVIGIAIAATSIYLVGTIPPEAVVLFLGMVLSSFVGRNLKSFVHPHVDLKFGKRTIVHLLGFKRAAFVCAGLYVLGPVFCVTAYFLGVFPANHFFSLLMGTLIALMSAQAITLAKRPQSYARKLYEECRLVLGPGFLSSFALGSLL